MTREFMKDKWTCPNDRHLQLRAKLNAGWSFHTEQKMPFNNKNAQLSESELIAIQKVLQRSEYLEKLEQERVGKLVERLDNMKRNAMQSNNPSQGSNRCGICGDYFCLLRAAPTNCNLCQKILCSKCCIDTLCSVDDLASRTNGLSLSYRNTGSSGSHKTLWLCRICSEQRELWKKSGAWFFKKYPSYLAPNLKSCGSITSTLSEPQNKEQLHKYALSSLLSNKEQVTHQVSFSLPTTPSKQKFISNQNSPNKLWSRDDSQNRDNNLLTDSSDYDDQTNDVLTNDTNTDTNNNNNNNQINNNNNQNNQNNSSTNNNNVNLNSTNNVQMTSFNQILTNNFNVFVPNTLNTFNFGNNSFPTNSFNTVNNNSTNPGHRLNNSNITVNNINNTNNVTFNTSITNNETNINNSTCTSPSSPHSKNHSNASSPISVKNNNNNKNIINHNDTVSTNSKPTPQRTRRSFRKPKLLEWCSNQFSFGEFGSNSSLNDTRKKSSSTSSPQSTPPTPLFKSKFLKSSKTNLTENLNQ